MAKYRIVEVQECTRMRRWIHEVDAASPEEAIELVAEGKAALVNEGDPIGEEDYGDSGYAVEVEGEDATQAAINSMFA